MPPNRLYYGDNLEILRTRIRDESVHFCYIDPPFNSKRNYNQIYNRIGQEDLAQEQSFIDTWTWNDQARDGYNEIRGNIQGRFTAQTIELIAGLHKVLGEDGLLAYLISITLRLVEINRVLAPNGSFYLHCDPTASHYLKLICDSVFCADGTGDFKNEIIWRRTGAHGPRRSFGPVHDTILFYTKGSDYYFKTILRPYMLGHVKQRYRLEDNGKLKFTSGGNVLTGSGKTNGESGQSWKGFDPSAKNRHWAVPGFLTKQMPPGFKKLSVLEKLDALYAAKLIDIVEGAAWPTPVRYLDPESSGQPLQDIWAYQPYTERTVYGTDEGIDADVKWLGPTDPERRGYQTQKPEGLLVRMIESSCPAGGVVLDAYCGCGTTVAVAQDRNRNWIAIDITYQAIAEILSRLEDKFGKAVADSVVLDGIPKDMASARALAHKRDDRVRKEFEKWAILAYTNNRAVIKKKKGADGGIDGLYYFWNGGELNAAKMVIQAKSGGVTRKDIAALRGDMEKEGASLACLITLEPETRPMVRDARAAGVYENQQRGIRCDRLRIVRIEDIIHNRARIELALHPEAANRARRSIEGDQLTLNLTSPEGERVPETVKKEVAVANGSSRRKASAVI